MTAAFAAVRERLQAAAIADHGEAMEIIDEVLEFVRGGLDAMRTR